MRLKRHRAGLYTVTTLTAIGPLAWTIEATPNKAAWVTKSAYHQFARETLAQVKVQIKRYSEAGLDDLEKRRAVQ